jgi:hypothetical protein
MVGPGVCRSSIVEGETANFIPLPSENKRLQTVEKNTCKCVPPSHNIGGVVDLVQAKYVQALQP